MIYVYLLLLTCCFKHSDNSRYVEANAGCKHFDVHGGPENIPVSRFSFDAKVTPSHPPFSPLSFSLPNLYPFSPSFFHQVSTRDWRMTFLPQFRECVEAGAWSLMCSYNRQ